MPKTLTADEQVDKLHKDIDSFNRTINELRVAVADKKLAELVITCSVRALAFAELDQIRIEQLFERTNDAKTSDAPG